MGDCRGKRVCLRVAEQLSDKYNAACREFRAFGLPYSAAEKLAKLLLELSVRNGGSRQGAAAHKASVNP